MSLPACRLLAARLESLANWVCRTEKTPQFAAVVREACNLTRLLRLP